MNAFVIALVVSLVGAAAAADVATLTYIGVTTNCTTRQTTYWYRVGVTSGQDLAAVVFGFNSTTPVAPGTYAVSGYDSATGLTGLRQNLPARIPASQFGMVSVTVDDVYTVGEIHWAGVWSDGSATRVLTTMGPAPFAATAQSDEDPESIAWNMTIRDINTHPDFESHQGDERGIVEATLGADGTPVLAPGKHRTILDAESFKSWFHDVPGVNKHLAVPMRASRVPGTNPPLYEYDNQTFFPIDGMGFGNNFEGHNFGFTMMISTLFTYRGGENFTFRGDDDVWVFINRHLVIDLGGVHPAEEASIDVDTLGLEVNETYSLAFFFAERHTSRSSFRMTTSLQLQDCARDTCGLCVGTCDHDTDGDGIKDCVDPQPLVPDYICGDGVCQASETCDSCLKDCMGVKCECPGLNHVEAQHLKDPPTLNHSLSGSLGDDITLSIVLPQMIPHRWDVHAAFVNPDTFATTQVALPMAEDYCRYTHVSTRRLPDLIRTAQPRIIESAETYRMQFIVRVWWNERFVLSNGEAYDRNSTADLPFEVILYRQLDVRSVISSLDATLVWGYIEKLSVFVPIDRSSPTVEFDLVTVAVEADYAIVPRTFVFNSSVGHIVAVTSPALVGVVDGHANKQRWHLRATIDRYAICSTSASDKFTLDYAIASARPQSATHASQLTASLEGLENWCMLNSTVRLNGAQSTHADAVSPAETLRFFVGDVIHVRDHVFTDVVLKRTDVTRVVLSGNAIKSGAELTIYDAASPSATALGFALEDCPASSGPTWVCYRFTLAAGTFDVDKELRIVSSLSATVNEHPGRRAAETKTSTARVSSTLGLAQTAVAAPSSAEQVVVKGAASSAAFGAAAVVAVAFALMC
eukprot:m51a1_g14827 hypothetical protein (864) ;mRNA; r:672931-675655